MGGSESKTSSDHISWSSEEDKLRANTRFNSISHGQKSFTRDQFHHFTNPLLDSKTSGRLFDLLLQPLSHGHHQNQAQPPEVHHHNFMSHLKVILYGNLSEKAKIILFLASTSPSNVSSTDLVSFVGKILQCYERLMHAHCVAYQSWMFQQVKGSHERLAVSLLSSLLSSGNEKPKTVVNSAPEVDPNLSFSEMNIEEWLSRCSFFREILDHCFVGIFQFNESQPGQNQMIFSPRVPQVQDTNWSRCSTIIDFPTVLFVNDALPSNMQSPWKLLFSNHTHGGSFSQLLKHIRNRGPTVVLVRDEQGHVFGGFASTAWDINAKFQGNGSCFLFQVNPRYSIYQSTGYNENFMYMNHHVKTLPNGVGMGGQFDFFGLWIDQSFDNGHSKAGAKGCSTFGSPQLSANPEFKVHTLEVWAVGRAKREGESDDLDDVEGAQKSILDKLSAEDKAILEMVDKGTISDAIREEPIVEETAAHNTIISPF